MGGRRRHRFGTGGRRVARVYQHVDVRHGEDALAAADLAFEPVVVHPAGDHHQLTLRQRELQVGLGHEVVLGPGLALVGLARGGLGSVVCDDLEENQKKKSKREEVLLVYYRYYLSMYLVN